MRIIDADALRAELEHYDKDEHLMWCELDMYKVVDAQPTIERPQGKWYHSIERGWHCSECDEVVKDMPTCMRKATYKFCPNCGADMRGDRE